MIMDSNSTIATIGIIKAVNFAAIKHKKQKRKDGEGTPYINHPIGVANFIIEIGKVHDLATIQAALLHDTVEDTETSFEEIEKEFGIEVKGIVAEVTDNKSLPKNQRKKLQVEHAPHKSMKAKIVKLSDKLYNLRDLLTSAPEYWQLIHIQGYFVWAEAVVKGLRGTNESLEIALDEVFKGEFTYKDKKYPVLPPLSERDDLFQQYYTSL